MASGLAFVVATYRGNQRRMSLLWFSCKGSLSFALIL
jgi:hypothetical protein